ncbi:MAG: DUF1003 domain-containing protein [Armatimonadota bacterium]
MNISSEGKAVCAVCQRSFLPNDLIPGAIVRQSLVGEIRKDHPEWSNDDFICRDDLEHYRSLYVQHSLEQDNRELTEVEGEVVKAINDDSLLAKNINDDFDTKSTFGQRTADKVAKFGGSWNFIILFGTVLAIWITMNSIILIRHFDPYPFILLNLVLSCIAAIQAPVIMMSQNRQETRDRLRAEHDYQINLKAELEIRAISEKIDHLLHQQWQRLLEIQQIQTDFMEDISKRTHTEAEAKDHPADDQNE